MVYLHLRSYLKEINLCQSTIEISILAIELYKVFNGICPEIMKDVFLLSISSNYDTRSRRTFTTRSVKAVYHGTEPLLYLAPKVWELIPVT